MIKRRAATGGSGARTVMAAVVITALSAAVSIGCSPTEVVDAEHPSYGPISGKPVTTHLPGDILDEPFVVLKAETIHEEFPTQLIGVPVDFTIADPSVARIVGPTHIVTFSTGPEYGATAPVRIEFLKEGTTTLEASVAGATYTDPDNHQTLRVATSVPLKVLRPGRIAFLPASPVYIESRSEGVQIAGILQSLTGEEIDYSNFKWMCPQGEGIVAMSGTGRCNDLLTKASFAPRSAGTATFRAAVDDALFARFPVANDFQVVVTNSVARIDLAAAPVSVGSTGVVTPTLRDAAGAALPQTLVNYTGLGPVVEHLSWSSSDVSVATVDSHGVVTGIAPDAVTITATYFTRQGGSLPKSPEGSVTLNVGPTTNVVTIDVPSFSMVVGATRLLEATVRDASGKLLPNSIVWLSRDVSIAKVSSVGAIVSLDALSTGPSPSTPSATVQVLARAAGAQAVATVTVYRKVATIELTPSSTTMRTGQRLPLVAKLLDGSGNVIPLSATKLTWTSLDATNLSVDADGVVTAAAPSATPARIKVSEGGGATATANIVVLPPVSTVSLAIATASGTRPVLGSEALTVGASTTLVATLKDANGATITDALSFASSTPSVASVVASNATTASVNGLAPGTTTIRVSRTSDPTAFATATFTVAGPGGPATRIVVSSVPTNATTNVGGTVTFSAAVLDALGNPASDCPINWATQLSSVASILPSGVATGAGAGTTGVHAFCTDRTDLSMLTRMMVTNATGIAQVNITPRFVYLPAAGASQVYTASFLPAGTSGTVDWQLLQSPAGVLTSTPSGTNNASVTIAVPAGAGTAIAGGERIVARAGGQSDTSWVTYGNAGSIKGTAVSTSGQYLGGLLATATPTAGGASFSGGVNNEGVFYLVGLPAGSYTVVVRQLGNPTAQTFTNVAVTAGGTALLTVAPFP